MPNRHSRLADEHTAQPQTLATLVEQLSADESLPAWRRRSLRTHIRCLCRLLGLDPASTPADLASIAERIARFRPQRAGIEQRHWQNIVGGVRFALRYAGCSVVPGRDCTPLSPGWAALLEQISEVNRGLRFRLARFARWCGAGEIGPEKVDQAVLQRFQAEIEASAGREQASRSARAVIRAWIAAAATVSGWPPTQIALPPHPRRWTPTLDQLSAGLRDEIESFLKWARQNDLLSDYGPRRPRRQSTIASYLYVLRAYVGSLTTVGHDLDSLNSLRDLVVVNTVKDGLRELVRRSGEQNTARAHRAAIVLKVIARDYLQIEEPQVVSLAEFCRRLTPKMQLTPKNRERLRPFDDLHHVGALLHLPGRLMRDAQRAKPDQRRGALDAQIAVAIEILQMCPLRISNLAFLNIERHLAFSRGGRAGLVHIVIPGEEVKNGQPIESELPADATKLLVSYLDKFRPRLIEHTSPWLFPGRNGGPKHPRVLAKQISDTIRQRTGLDVNPHLFRHIGAKLYLDAQPGGYEVVRQVNGNQSIGTTIRYYTGMETAAAVRHFDATILRLRASTKAPLPPRRSRRSRR